MPFRTRPAGFVAVLALSSSLLFGCAGGDLGPAAPERTPVAPQIAAAPSGVSVAPAPPEFVELRSADGVTYFGSPVHPEPLFRDGQVLNPVDERPAWWGESGLPATDSRETVAVVGHNYSTRTAPFAVLRLAQQGDVIAVRTSAGVLEYRVERVGPLPKGSLLADNELRRQVPGRIVLANCDVIDGESTADNYVVVGELES